MFGQGGDLYSLRLLLEFRFQLDLSELGEVGSRMIQTTI